MTKKDLLYHSLYYHNIKIKEIIITISLISMFLISTFTVCYLLNFDKTDEHITSFVITTICFVILLVLTISLLISVYSNEMIFKIKLHDGFDNFGITYRGQAKYYAFKNFYTTSTLESDKVYLYSSDEYYKNTSLIHHVLRDKANYFNKIKAKMDFDYDISIKK